jgi:hypothetical protein
MPSASAFEKDGLDWLEKYRADANRVFKLRQEHIHLKNAKGVREPLTACRSKDKPENCKHGFEKEKLIYPKARVICQGVAENVGLSYKGKRNAIGSLEAARNSGSLNGAVPALSVASGDNNDIKIPFRFAITEATHEASCSRTCPQTTSLREIIKAIEASQAAQVGYHCDYANKRQVIGLRECREWCKGLNALGAKLQQGHEQIPYIAARYAKRIISNCFARGIMRTPNETAKLNDIAGHPEPTSAELFCTAAFRTFPGEAFMSIFEGRANVDASRFEKGLL